MKPRALVLATFAALAAVIVPRAAFAFASTEAEVPVQRSLPQASVGGSPRFGTATSNCAGAACDTVWIGHSNAGPGGSFLGVTAGGVWDFDSGIAGTDSTQGWRFWALPVNFGATRTVPNRLEWARDYGNSINDGDQGLWNARILGGRKFVKTGVSGAWHADNMAGVKRKLNDPFEPSATPIAGARSAWCGLREAGNTHPDALDALTGNYLNGDLAIHVGGVGTLPEFPGFCNQWDQMLYKDFAGSTGSGTVSFRVRTDMSDFIDTVVSGSGWFHPFPEPELLANHVLNPADSFMVYVGSPTETAYDTNRRWFSEVLDLSKPHQQLFRAGGVYPFVAADTAISRPYSGLQAGTIRVVFRVKTNRIRSDQSTGTNTGYNSKQGAALVDEVSVDGGPVEGFETTAQVTARSLIPNLAAPGGPWATTGRPPHQYFHVENVLASGLAYEDLCGGIGTPTRICNLVGNVFLPGNHDDPNHVIPSGPTPPTENYMVGESPTIDLAVRLAAPGTKNAQGIDRETALRTNAQVRHDFYSGHMDLDESLFYRYGLRAHGPQFVSPVSGTRIWSGVMFVGSILFNPDPLCYIETYGASALGATIGQQDSLKVILGVITQGYRFGGNNLGNTQGTYFDNVRLGLVRGSAGDLSSSIWHQFQDQFPWNEAVPPGDNAGFDTTAALLNTGLNIIAPANDVGVVAGDSLYATAPYTGNGTSTGTRLDLVFRIDPGPGNYVTKGNRASALVNRDPAHPFFATYLANNGPFGTPGGHGGTWNRHAWNSARMDSAEANVYPIVSRNIGNPASPGWMSTLHEADPNFASLGILKNVCFLVDPNGAFDETNLTCAGTPPAVYGAVSGTTREGTKILPDGWFTPGTHIEYFVRSSTLEAPAVATLLFDTTRVFPQDPSGLADFDGDRWHSVDVLPDMWKSSRYGGSGLACMLLVDDNDRRGAERAIVGAADSMGYGKNNGAKKGWKGLGPGSDPNDPAGFVAANRGQAGFAFDLYEIRASESGEAGHPGVRLANNHGAVAAKGDKSGPSVAMLAALYNIVLHASGDLSSNTLHDGTDSQEGADDITLYDNWITGASLANARNLWLNGDGIAEDATLVSDDGTVFMPWVAERFGVSMVSQDYKIYSGTPSSTVGFLPLAPWSHPGRVYGFNNHCTIHADVLRVENTVAGAAAAAQYQAIGSGTEFTSSVFRPREAGVRHYRTLFDGFDLSHLRGHYANLGQIATLPGTDIGRLAWLGDALQSHFAICVGQPAVIAIGDLPGFEGELFANVNLGAAPNPAFAGRKVALRFTLARPGPITVRVFNVAGREVARVAHEGVAGPNDVVWDGTLDNGSRAAAGVYFYRVDGVAFTEGAAKNKLVLLGPDR